MEKKYTRPEASKVIKDVVEYLVDERGLSKKEIAQAMGLLPEILTRLMDYDQYKQKTANKLTISKWANKIIEFYQIQIDENGGGLSFLVIPSNGTMEYGPEEKVEITHYHYDYFYWSKDNRVRKAIFKVEKTWCDGEIQFWSHDHNTLYESLQVKIRETARVVYFETTHDASSYRSLICFYKGELNPNNREILCGVFAGIRLEDETPTAGKVVLIKRSGSGHEEVGDEKMALVNAYLFKNNVSVQAFISKNIEQFERILSGKAQMNRVEGVYEQFVPSSDGKEVAKYILEIKKFGMVRVKGPDENTYYMGKAILTGNLLHIDTDLYGDEFHPVHIVMAIPPHYHEYLEGFSVTTNRTRDPKAARVVLRKIKTKFEEAVFEIIDLPCPPNNPYAKVAGYLSGKTGNVLMSSTLYLKGEMKPTAHGQTLFEAACYKAMRGQIMNAISLLKDALQHGFSNEHELWKKEFLAGGALDNIEIKKEMGYFR